MNIREVTAMKDNYALSLEAARRHFLSYDPGTLARRPGVGQQGPWLTTRFLGAEARIHGQTGKIFLSRDGFESCWEADFSEALSVYDWLCDRKPDAAPSGEFCPVGSLPGVYVGGSGLSMTGGTLPQRIDRDPQGFQTACTALGAVPVAMGDLGLRLYVFPDLPMLVKFYHGDEDFPPSLTLLWDKNTLRFVRYETVYYIAGCLLKYISHRMNREQV